MTWTLQACSSYLVWDLSLHDGREKFRLWFSALEIETAGPSETSAATCMCVITRKPWTVDSSAVHCIVPHTQVPAVGAAERQWVAVRLNLSCWFHELAVCSLFDTDLIQALLRYFPTFLGARQPLLHFPYPRETACPIRQSITTAPWRQQGREK
jgi:hypothetical protein